MFELDPDQLRSSQVHSFSLRFSFKMNSLRHMVTQIYSDWFDVDNVQISSDWLRSAQIHSDSHQIQIFSDSLILFKIHADPPRLVKFKCH